MCLDRLVLDEQEERSTAASDDFVRVVVESLLASWAVDHRATATLYVAYRNRNKKRTNTREQCRLEP